MSFLARRPISFTIVLSVVLSSLAVLVPSMTKVAEAAPRTKFTICHRTNAITNPYRRITVAWSSVNDDGNGHDNPSHDGPVFNIANPSVSHGTLPRDSGLGAETGGGNDRWGDIFNVSRTTGPQNDRANSKNWTTEGQAIFNGATFTHNGVTKQACRLMTAQEHLASEIPALLANEAAKPQADRRTDAQVVGEVMVELDEMGAAEDTALKQGLTGGSFSSWYAACTNNCTDPNTLTTTLNNVPQPSVTTTTPTVTSTTTATLTGTITPLGGSMSWYFELSPTNDFSDSNVLVENYPSTPQGPSTVQGPATVTNNATGLTAGTTYFYRTVGIVPSGSGDAAIESFYYGPIEQFTTPGAPSVTTEPATSITETTATINGTGTSNGASSTVTFTWGISPTLTVGNNTVTASQSPLGTTASGAAVSAALTGLTGGTTYYFQTTVQNVNGTVRGIIRQFTTTASPNAPAVTTEPATSITETTATINGTGTSNGASSTVTFTWGISPTLTVGNNTVTASQSPLGTTASGAAVSAALTGLTGGTTYYFQTTIQNVNGTVDGIIRQFTTTATSTAPASTPTTTVPTTAQDDPLGRVIGTAWFDINRNNRRDTGEPLLAGVDVALTPRAVTGQSFANVRKQSFVMKTSSAGAFDFSDLPPGTYVIKSILPGDFGIQESWDSSGNSDWEVTVTVVAQQTSRGDFAAVGTALATGSVDGGGGGSLDATWSGFDQTLGNDDDTTFIVSLSGSGGFTLSGLPQGKYSVKATSKAGRTLVSSNALQITKSGAQLSIGGLTMSVKIVAILPQTGAMGLSLPLGFAAMLIPVGIASTGIVRRRRRS